MTTVVEESASFAFLLEGGRNILERHSRGCVTGDSTVGESLKIAGSVYVLPFAFAADRTRLAFSASVSICRTKFADSSFLVLALDLLEERNFVLIGCSNVLGTRAQSPAWHVTLLHLAEECVLVQLAEGALLIGLHSGCEGFP